MRLPFALILGYVTTDAMQTECKTLACVLLETSAVIKQTPTASSTMATNTASPRDIIAKRLGYEGLSQVVQIKIAASNAVLILNTINHLLAKNYDDKMHPLVLRSCEAVARDCSGITDAYKAFIAAEDHMCLFLHLTEIVRRTQDYFLVPH